MNRPPANLGVLAQQGPLVDRDKLLELILPAIEKHTIGGFARKAGVDPSGLKHMIVGRSGRSNPRLNYADKLLTNGLGRPDLLQFVCPVVESDAGEASSRRGPPPEGAR